MKIKLDIPKLQEGGTMSPFVGWQSVIPQPGQPEKETKSSSKASKSEEDEGLLSKDMIKILLEQGLPNDVGEVVERLQQLYNDPKLRVSGGLSSSAFNSRVTSLFGELNKVKFGKEAYNLALSNLTKNGGLNDIAISTTGRLFAQNEDGQIEQITPNEYYENLGDYRVITNSELAHMRATNPNLAFDESIFSVLNNGIGAEAIQSYINSAIQNIGTSSQKSEGFLAQKDGKIVGGLQQLYENTEIQEALLSNGAYKISRESKDQLQQSEAALRYLYATLPENAKQYLKGKAAVSGLDPNNGIQTILTQLLLSRQSATNNTGISYEASLSKDMGLDQKTRDEIKGQTSISQSAALQNGISNDIRNVTLNTGTNTQVTIDNSAHWNSILSAVNNQPLDNITAQDLVNQSSVGQAGDQNSIYFGNQRIDAAKADKVVIDTTKGISKVTLPYGVNEADGSIYPRLDILKLIDEAEEEIKRTPGMSPIEQRIVYNNKDIGQYYGIKNDPKFLETNKLGRDFYVVNAIASNTDDVVNTKNIEDPLNGNQYVHEMDKDERDRWVKRANDVITDGLKKGASNYKYDIGGAWYQFGKGKLYSGNLYIAASTDRITPSIVEKNLTTAKKNYDVSNVERRGTAAGQNIITSEDSLNY